MQNFSLFLMENCILSNKPGCVTLTKHTWNWFSSDSLALKMLSDRRAFTAGLSCAWTVYDKTELRSKHLWSDSSSAVTTFMIRLKSARTFLWSDPVALGPFMVKTSCARNCLWSDSSALEFASDQTQMRSNPALIRLKCARIRLWSVSRALLRSKLRSRAQWQACARSGLNQGDFDRTPRRGNSKSLLFFLYKIECYFRDISQKWFKVLAQMILSLLQRLKNGTCCSWQDILFAPGIVLVCKQIIDRIWVPGWAFL